MEPDQPQEFIEQLARHQDQVYSYILALAPNWSDADEMMQTTTISLWKKWKDFDHDRPFIRWACGVARLEVLKYLGKQNRWLSLSPEVMEQLADEYSGCSDALDARSKALAYCIEKLPSSKRSLVRRCYAGNEKINEIASSLKLTANSIYLKLQRIRKTLHACIDKVVSESESST